MRVSNKKLLRWLLFELKLKRNETLLAYIIYNKNSEPISWCELAYLLEVDWSTISRNLKKLQNKDVILKSSTKSGRGYKVSYKISKEFSMRLKVYCEQDIKKLSKKREFLLEEYEDLVDKIDQKLMIKDGKKRTFNKKVKEFSQIKDGKKRTFLTQEDKKPIKNSVKNHQKLPSFTKKMTMPENSDSNGLTGVSRDGHSINGYNNKNNNIILIDSGFSKNMNSKTLHEIPINKNLTRASHSLRFSSSAISAQDKPERIASGKASLLNSSVAKHTQTKHEKKKEKFLKMCHGVLAEFNTKDSIVINIAIDNFFTMLMNSNALLPEISIRVQLQYLAEFTLDEQLEIINFTVMRGWKSLDYAIKNMSERKQAEKNNPMYFGNFKSNKADGKAYTADNLVKLPISHEVF